MIPMITKQLVVVTALLCLPAGAAGLEAYHTRLDPSPAGYSGKYVDLVVTLGNGNRLEFARANGYLPQWRTKDGVFSVENLFPGRDADTNRDYTYVRLIESGPDKVVVHWRHFKDIEILNRSKLESVPDSLNPHGITGVIHEMFTIHPDGSVQREVRDAENTRYEDWIDPRLITRQTLKLTAGGIAHSPVSLGQKPPLLPRPSVKGNLVREFKGLPAPEYHWSFDDGMTPHDDHIKESISGTTCGISGLMTRFKKGVSGTALALDGYYTGVSMTPATTNAPALTVEAWVAMDAYPYNTAPLIHQSTGCGEQGWYLGLDAFGKPFVRYNGVTAQTTAVLPLYQWSHVCATIDSGNLKLYINGELSGTKSYTPSAAAVKIPSTPLLLGRNNEPLKCTDIVRAGKPNRNLGFLFGIQGLLDEVRVYGKALSASQVSQAYQSLRPADLTSDLAKGVLPRDAGTVRHFGATYKMLSFSDVWDPLWRDPSGSEVVVNFDKLPCRVVSWRGTNYAPNWVTENNRWMADQSSENGGDEFGCSEHMADKQNRHCHTRIIENTPARVMIHWRYPSVGISYINLKPTEWSDEYFTIYPDGTSVRKVYWNTGLTTHVPSFQDIQFLTSPGELPMDIMDLQALTVMDTAGTAIDLTWTEPNKVPENPLEDARVELCHSKSDYKVFAIFQGGGINPWSEHNKVVIDPFAGPWNHWPMALCPSDGRFAVANDRVTHFALAANDGAKNPDGMSLVLYGFSAKHGFSAGDGQSANQNQIKSLLPLAKSWTNPPAITAINGCTAAAYNKESRDFPLRAKQETMQVRIQASAASPVINPCFTVHNWGHRGAAVLDITGAAVKDVRQGTIVDTDGTRTLVLWAELNASVPIEVTIRGAKPFKPPATSR